MRVNSYSMIKAVPEVHNEQVNGRRLPWNCVESQAGNRLRWVIHLADTPSGFIGERLRIHDARG